MTFYSALAFGVKGILLYQFQSSITGENLQQLWASMVMVTLPLVLVYFLLQDQFIKAFANVSFK